MIWKHFFHLRPLEGGGGLVMGSIDVSLLFTWDKFVAICEGDPPVTKGFPCQRAWHADFDIFFNVRQNKQLKHSSCWWHIFTYHRLSIYRGHILHDSTNSTAVALIKQQSDFPLTNDTPTHGWAIESLSWVLQRKITAIHQGALYLIKGIYE